MSGLTYTAEAGIAQELRQKFNDIAVASTAPAEEDLKRVIEIMLWQQMEIFERETNRETEGSVVCQAETEAYTKLGQD